MCAGGCAWCCVRCALRAESQVQHARCACCIECAVDTVARSVDQNILSAFFHVCRADVEHEEMRLQCGTHHSGCTSRRMQHTTLYVTKRTKCSMFGLLPAVACLSAVGCPMITPSTVRNSAAVCIYLTKLTYLTAKYPRNVTLSHFMQVVSHPTEEPYNATCSRCSHLMQRNERSSTTMDVSRRCSHTIFEDAHRESCIPCRRHFLAIRPGPNTATRCLGALTL